MLRIIKRSTIPSVVVLTLTFPLSLFAACHNNFSTDYVSSMEPVAVCGGQTYQVNNIPLNQNGNGKTRVNVTVVYTKQGQQAAILSLSNNPSEYGVVFDNGTSSVNCPSGSPGQTMRCSAMITWNTQNPPSSVSFGVLNSSASDLLVGGTNANFSGMGGYCAYPFAWNIRDNYGACQSYICLQGVVGLGNSGVTVTNSGNVVSACSAQTGLSLNGVTAPNCGQCYQANIPQPQSQPSGWPQPIPGGGGNGGGGQQHGSGW